MEIAGLNQEQARDIVFKKLEEEMSMEMAIYVKDETEKAIVNQEKLLQQTKESQEVGG